MSTASSLQSKILTKKEALESSLYYFTTRQPFYGGMLQEMSIRYSETVPTAGLLYDKVKDEFSIHLNEKFFCSLPLEQRIGILSHEILHFSHGHAFRSSSIKDTSINKNTMQKKQLENIAQDMAINQYIAELPDGCVRVENFKTNNGMPFPKFRAWEEYRDLLEDNKNDNNEEELEKYGAGENNDVHGWEDLTEEEQQRMLREAQKIIKRTIEKTSKSHDLTPDSIKELLKEIEQKIQGINYKRILQSIFKKSLSIADRTYKWNRPNRRYGNYAPGSTNGEIPRVAFYTDTSGSISHKEANQFFNVMDGFLKVGQKKSTVGFWHTELYLKQKYKTGMRFEDFNIQAGGTDINCILKDLKKNPADLCVVLTDGYFGEIRDKMKGSVVWIISKGGTADHPGKHIGVTIPLDKLVDE